MIGIITFLLNQVDIRIIKQTKKGGYMSLMKRSEWPLLANGPWLSDFFDNDRFFDSDWLKKQSVPAVNVKETEKNFEIEVAAPGLSKKDFKITVDNGVLTISSEKKEERKERRERAKGKRLHAERIQL